MDIQIKHLKVGDETILEHVAIDVFDETIDPHYLASYLAEPTHHMIIAINETEVVGQIRAIIHKHPDRPDELYIDNLGVTPTLQRQGIATKLLNAINKTVVKKLGWQLSVIIPKRKDFMNLTVSKLNQ